MLLGETNEYLQLAMQSRLLGFQRGQMEPSVFGNFQALTGLLDLDIAIRVLNLRDCNDSNLGYLMAAADPFHEVFIDDAVARTWLCENHQFRMVDFVP